MTFLEGAGGETIDPDASGEPGNAPGEVPNNAANAAASAGYGLPAEATTGASGVSGEQVSVPPGFLDREQGDNYQAATAEPVTRNADDSPEQRDQLVKEMARWGSPVYYSTHPPHPPAVRYPETDDITEAGNTGGASATSGGEGDQAAAATPHDSDTESPSPAARPLDRDTARAILAKLAGAPVYASEFPEMHAARQASLLELRRTAYPDTGDTGAPATASGGEGDQVTNPGDLDTESATPAAGFAAQDPTWARVVERTRALTLDNSTSSPRDPEAEAAAETGDTGAPAKGESEGSQTTEPDKPAESASAGFDSREWDEHQLSKGPAYWQETARANDLLAEDYAERASEQPEHPDAPNWKKLSETFGEIARTARELVAEAAARTAKTTE